MPPAPRPTPIQIPLQCKQCTLQAVSTPVVVIPILVKHAGREYRYPQNVSLQAQFGLCPAHAASFTLSQWGDYAGSWHDMVADHVRERKRPAVNPFPDDPTFRFEEWLVDPHWHAAPMEQCYVTMQPVAKFQASRGMRQRLM